MQDVIACAGDMFFKEDLGEVTRADVARLFHEILLGSTSTINDVYAAAAHLPADLTLWQEVFPKTYLLLTPPMLSFDQLKYGKHARNVLS